MAEVQGAHLWTGLNRKVNPNDLPEDASPDLSNCRHYGGVVGQLGPRPGKTFVNSRGYEGNILSVFPYNPGNGTYKYLLGDTLGTVHVVDAPRQGSDNPPSNYVSTTHGVFDYDATENSTTINYPSTTATFSVTPTDTLDASTLAALRFGFRIIPSVAAAAGSGSVTFSFGAVVGGVPVTIGTAKVNYYNSAASALGNVLLYTTDNVTYGSQGWTFPLGMTGNVTSILGSATVAWPPGAAGGDNMFVGVRMG